MKKYARLIELFCWVTGLVLLACMPVKADVHYSLCLFKQLGIGFCPGCGLGHSISYLFHGELQASLRAHPLGIPALLILVHRIYQLCMLHLFLNFKIKAHGQ